VIEDASNTDRRFRRNAIRHDVLPLLESVSPGATGNLARFGSLVGDEDAFLEAIATSALGDAEVVDRETLLSQPLVIQRRMIRVWLKRHLGEVEVSRDRIDAVVAAVSERRGPKTIEIGGGWSVEIGRDALSVVMGIR
jgi:tRNA(Ile)-lysidine synthase